MNALNNKDTGSLMKKIEQSMKTIKIEDSFFAVKVFEDQEQFKIKDWHNLQKRLSNEETLTAFHES